MAKICINCGKKISFFDDPIEINDNDCLCSICSFKICNVYYNTVYAERIEEFASNASKLLDKAEAKYNNNTLLTLQNKICDTYVEKFENVETLSEHIKLHTLINNITKKRKIEAENQKQLESESKRQAEEKRLKLQKANDDFLKKNGHTGYYEYMVVNVFDSDDGSCDINNLTTKLNELGRQGWHLKCSYANEMGKNSSSAGVGGFSAGTNVTIEQNILIFERFLKFSEE